MNDGKPYFPTSPTSAGPYREGSPVRRAGPVPTEGRPSEPRVVSRPEAPPASTVDPLLRVVPGSTREQQIEEVLRASGVEAPPWWMRYARAFGGAALGLGLFFVYLQVRQLNHWHGLFGALDVLLGKTLRVATPLLVLFGAWLLAVGIRRTDEGYISGFWKLGTVTVAVLGLVLGLAYQLYLYPRVLFDRSLLPFFG
jgi:hypothetical protein